MRALVAAGEMSTDIDVMWAHSARFFFLGIDNKKRFLAVGKLECRSEPPCEAQPRRVALMLRLAAAEQSACLGMPPQRHPCKNTLTEQMKLETAVKGI